MNLSENPYLTIERPRFGDEEQKAKIEERWAEYGRDVAMARIVFVGLGDMKPPADPIFLRGHGAVLFVKNSLRGISKATDQAIKEGIRRYLNSDGCDKRGYLPWERDIELAQPKSALKPPKK